MNAPLNQFEKGKILIIENDFNLGNFLKEHLNGKGFSTTLCTNGEDALKEFIQSDFLLCIANLETPIKGGLELVNEIRNTDCAIPILILSDKNSEKDIIEGFLSGADDYLCKPFNTKELLLRIQAILRRSSGYFENKKRCFNLGKCVYEYHHQRLVSENSGIISLTAKENELLWVLSKQRNKTVERSDILNKVWHNNDYFSARSMDVYLAKIRKHLKTHTLSNIVNIHGIGFKLITRET